MRFRDSERGNLPIFSLFPDADWHRVGNKALICAVWAKLNELNPSTVLIPGWYNGPALVAALWAKLHGKHSILMSETTEQDHPRVAWRELCKSILIKVLFDSCVVGGKPHVRYLAQLGVPLTKIGHYYDVVDNLFYRERSINIRREPELRTLQCLPELYFLYVGRLAPEKNLAVTLLAFAQYRELGGTWSFVLVGDGPDGPALRDLCHDLDIIDGVIFAGLKTSSELAVFYAFAGCFILPSVREPWGLVVNEAMASSLPIIVSSRCGCVEDLVEHGGNGFVFDPADPTRLVQILFIVDRLSEPELDKLRRRSWEIVTRYSVQHWAEQIAALVQGRPSPPTCAS
jgi:glycosyltransferase involved in cell wall biosynthesis